MMEENMQQTIAPNNCTVGDTYHRQIVMADGTIHSVAFYLGTRAGVNWGMVKETLRHFSSALASIANGSLKCADGMNLRTNNGISKHGEARVSIWVKSPGIPVLLDDGMRFIQVNVFTEDTSAQDFIDMVYGHVNTMSEILSSGYVTLKRPPQQLNKKPQSALDEFFPRDENGKSVNTDEAPPSNTAVSKDGVIDLDYDYKEREQYETDYAGKKVRVHIGKIQWVVAVKKDKSGTYEQIQLFKESHHEHPIYDLSVWPHDETKDYSDGKTIVRAFPSGMLEKAGDYVEGNIFVVYKINPSAKHGKVFWNIQGVEHDIQPAQAKPSVQGVEFALPPENPDDIPF